LTLVGYATIADEGSRYAKSAVNFRCTDHMRRRRKPFRYSGRRFSREQLWALNKLAGTPHGVTEQMLVVAHGFSVGMLAGLVHGGFATVATETKMAPRGLTIKIDRIRITDDGRRAIDKAGNVSSIDRTVRHQVARPGRLVSTG
jgi:hypothetical protein